MRRLGSSCGRWQCEQAGVGRQQLELKPWPHCHLHKSNKWAVLSLPTLNCELLRPGLNLGHLAILEGAQEILVEQPFREYLPFSEMVRVTLASL